MCEPSNSSPSMLHLAKGGDLAALGILLDGFRTYLTLLAKIQIGQKLQAKVDPDDVVQDVFLDAHRQFSHFRGESIDELAAWLRKLMAGHLAKLIRHYCIAEARNIELEHSIERDLDSSSARLSGSIVSQDSSLREKMCRQEELLLLAETLKQILPDYQDVIILRQIEELSFREIAERMNRSEDSVQKLWVRGLQALRELLHKKTT